MSVVALSPTPAAEPSVPAAPRRTVRGYWGDVWRRFRRRKLALAALSFVLFMALVSLAAPFLVGIKPIMIRYQGTYYFPGLTSFYFDGYENPIFRAGRGAKKIVLEHYDEARIRALDSDAAFVWPLLYQAPSSRIKYDQIPGHAGNLPGAPPTGWNFSASPPDVRCAFTADGRFLKELKPDEDPPEGTEVRELPGQRNLFGTTPSTGVDVFTGMVYGTATALLIGFVSTGIAAAIGIGLGASAGYFRGWIDTLLSRVIEVVMCVPSLILILAIVAIVDKPKLWHVMVVIGCTSWTGIARLTRGEFLKLGQMEYVSAARAMGAGNLRIMFLHILPNALAPVLVPITFGIASAILTESALSFLGIGASPTDPRWGVLLNKASQDPTMWWLVVFPGGAIFLSVLAYNLIGEGLQEATDPRLRNR